MILIRISRYIDLRVSLAFLDSRNNIWNEENYFNKNLSCTRFLRDQIQEKISKLIQRILTSRKSITINYLNPSTITKIAK